jgi:hypothetical protein
MRQLLPMFRCVIGAQVESRVTPKASAKQMQSHVAPYLGVFYRTSHPRCDRRSI